MLPKQQHMVLLLNLTLTEPALLMDNTVTATT